MDLVFSFNRSDLQSLRMPGDFGINQRNFRADIKQGMDGAAAESNSDMRPGSVTYCGVPVGQGAAVASPADVPFPE